MYRKNIFLFLAILTMVFLQCLIIVVTMPQYIEEGIVLARYGISLLLFWLLMIAIAISNLCTGFFLKGGVKKLPIVASIGVGIFVSMLFLKGPLLEAYYFPNDFTNHMDFQFDYRKKIFYPSNFTMPVMRFYNSLKSKPGVHAIVEYPYTSPMCMYSWSSNPYHYYQHVHGKRVLMGEESKIFTSFQKKNIRLSNCIDIANPDSWRRRAHYLVIHKNILRESKTIGWGYSDDLIDNARFFADDYQAKMHNIVLRLRSIYGQPAYEDEYITVFKNG